MLTLTDLIKTSYDYLYRITISVLNFIRILVTHNTHFYQFINVHLIYYLNAVFSLLTVHLSVRFRLLLIIVFPTLLYGLKKLSHKETESFQTTDEYRNTIKTSNNLWNKSLFKRKCWELVLNDQFENGKLFVCLHKKEVLYNNRLNNFTPNYVVSVMNY